MRCNKRGRRALGALAVLVALAGVAFAAAGDLDPTFGTGGVVTYGAVAEARLVAVQPQGSGEAYVASGYVQEGGLYVTRYDASGVRDTSFGPSGDGVVRLFVGDGASRYATGALHVDAQGRILRVGTTTLTTTVIGKGNKTSTKTTIVMSVVRLTAQGLLDTSFGGTGMVHLDVSDRYANGLVELSDGRLVVGGTNLTGRKNNTWERTVLVCLNPDGSLDAGFGQGGVVYDTVRSLMVSGGIVLQSGNRIVVGTRPYFADQPNVQWMITRFDDSGAVDTSFGTDGRVLSDVAPLGPIAVDPANDALFAVAGGRPAGETYSRLLVARYAANGTLDTSYAQGGYATIRLEGGNLYYANRGVAVDASGSVALICDSPAYYGTSVIRLDASGAFDTTFGGGDGWSDFHGGSSVADPWFGLALANAADGIVVAGQSGQGSVAPGLFLMRRQK